MKNMLLENFLRTMKTAAAREIVFREVGMPRITAGEGGSARTVARRRSPRKVARAAWSGDVPWRSSEPRPIRPAPQRLPRRIGLRSRRLAPPSACLWSHVNGAAPGDPAPRPSRGLGALKPRGRFASVPSRVESARCYGA